MVLKERGGRGRKPSIGGDGTRRVQRVCPSLKYNASAHL